MPRGVKREKSVRLNEELEKINSLLEKSLENVRELQEKKKELERELEFCEKESLLEIVEQSGLSIDELKDAIASYSGQANKNDDN